ncbi:hypothetical protein D1631_00265 [Chryseobacterium nematophagum]|uniref:Uncharacterized protein n=1 Tax=Chryseobacterium nematophagum TaxID=2305228 RepID=A0A3M7TLZ1_9FLAO|nr:hypothetical protein D1631_00115 [Chryseobacterium nematophagum]RNA63977.1 hypothetical protein D1631_00265 [Chryseobacterium nematophagum]
MVKNSAKKSAEPLLFPFSVLHFIFGVARVFQDLRQTNFMRTKTQNFSSSGGVFYTHQFAELLPSLQILEHSCDTPSLFDFSAIQSLAFPDALFHGSKTKSTYDGIFLI